MNVTTVNIRRKLEMTQRLFVEVCRCGFNVLYNKPTNLYLNHEKRIIKHNNHIFYIFLSVDLIIFFPNIFFSFIYIEMSSTLTNLHFSS